MMSRIVVSAPGKVIIHGEHAVVFGKRALASSLELRTTLTLSDADDDVIRLHLPDIGINVNWKCAELSGISASFLPLDKKPKDLDVFLLSSLKKLAEMKEEEEEEVTDTKQLAVVAFLYLFCSIAVKNELVPCVHFEVNSLLPTSAGLGSSAAYSVCLAAGLLTRMGEVSRWNRIEERNWTEEDLELINGWAFMAEKVIHGTPSGIDNSISTYGGALCFQKGQQIRHLQHMPKLRILLVNTKIPRSTKALVESVRKKRDKYPDIVNPVLDSIESITSRFESVVTSGESICEETYETMSELIDMNQLLLVFLNVSHPTIERICKITGRRGLHSKLTGAGGGGCVVAIVPDGFASETMEQMTRELHDEGFDCFETSIGSEGVRVSF